MLILRKLERNKNKLLMCKSMKSPTFLDDIVNLE